MSTDRCTPGEWHLIVHKGHEHGYSIGTLEVDFHHDGDPMYWTIASVNTRRDGWEHNARLIAAAKNMYDALSYAVDNSDFNSETFDKMARAALAKANGGEL